MFLSSSLILSKPICNFACRKSKFPSCLIVEMKSREQTSKRDTSQHTTSYKQSSSGTIVI